MIKVERFGNCAFCGRYGIIERHHVQYVPEKTIKLCHNCHFKVHFFPNRLNEHELDALLRAKTPGSQILNVFGTKKNLNKARADLFLSLTRQSSASLSYDEALKRYKELVAPSLKESSKEIKTEKV
ncbi:MAG: hypothetical protein QXO15_10385 [Nitrososphaerota archaeon]